MAAFRCAAIPKEGAILYVSACGAENAPDKSRLKYLNAQLEPAAAARFCGAYGLSATSTMRRCRRRGEQLALPEPKPKPPDARLSGDVEGLRI